MPQVTVWKCPRTGKLFEDKPVYLTHLRRVAEKNHRDRMRARNEQSVRSRMDELYRLVSFVEIAEWIAENGPLLIDNWKLGTKSRHTSSRCRLSEVKIDQMQWSVRTLTRYAYSWKRVLPLDINSNMEYYPGWTGKISFNFVGAPYDVNDVLDAAGIRTIYSHSLSENVFKYQCVLFAADFPSLAVAEAFRRSVEETGIKE